MSAPDAQLVATVRDFLVRTESAPDDAGISAALRHAGVMADRRLLAGLVNSLRGELTGLGPVDRLVADPRVTDILVNGPGQVWVDRGAGLVRTDVQFADDDAVRALAVRLAARAGRRLDDAAPFVDARLPGGQRLHAVIAPLATRGTSISLRIPSRRRFGVADLVAAGSVDPDGARWLVSLVRSRAAFLVTGGTGSGKTSVLGALLGLVPGHERLVVVEDTAELDPDHPHVVSLESRPPNLEGRGEVTLRTLVRQAMRMRPDRIVVGEVRGAEVVELLGALNTGHEGGCGTLHANSAQDVPERLAALALAAGMSRDGVHAQVTAGLDVVIHLVRGGEGRRVVQEIGIVIEEGRRAVVAAGLVRQSGALRPGPAYPRLAALLVPSLPDIPGAP